MTYDQEGNVKRPDGSSVVARVIEHVGDILSTCYGTFILTGNRWLYVVDQETEFIPKN